MKMVVVCRRGDPGAGDGVGGEIVLGAQGREAGP